MKYIVKIGYIFFSILFLIYLSFPSYNFPNQIPHSLQSKEPADLETSVRRSYYTDFDRGQIMSFYQSEFEAGIFSRIPLTYRLNYPPEEAQVLIRDQARSTYLEEVVHPFRESFFINGFEPKEDKDNILVNGKKWRQKVTIKLVQSSTPVRLFTGVVVIIFIPLLLKGWEQAFTDIFLSFKKIWNFR